MEKIYDLILIPWLCMAIITFILLLKITAPYGKFFNKNFGFSLPYKIGWFIQESISPIFFATFFLLNGVESDNKIVWIFFLIWILHLTTYYDYPINAHVMKDGTGDLYGCIWSN